MSQIWDISDVSLSKIKSKPNKNMFELDQVLEYWATKYKKIKHDPAAKSKDKGFFRIQEIDLQSEWSRNMNSIDKPCLLFRMAEDGSVNSENINRLDRFWGIYLAIKQKGAPNNVVDELGAADCKRDLMKMTSALIAWLARLQSWATNGRTDVSNPFFSLTDRETREGLRGLRLNKTAFWTTPMHLNGWWLMGIELYGIDPRPLCVNNADYIDE